jgi:hypothetical protein
LETLFTVIIVYILLELFEVQWQKAENMMTMMLRMHSYYRKNILLFFILHPTFYFAIWLVMATNYNTAAASMLLIKTVDLVTKILLIRQIFEKREISPEMSMMLHTPLHPLMPYIGLIVYTPLVFMALYF